MNNLLPHLAQDFTDEKLVEKAVKAKTWQPRRADPADDKNIPFGLGAAMTRMWIDASALWAEALYRRPTPTIAG